MQRLLTFSRVYLYLAWAVLIIDLAFKGTKVCMHADLASDTHLR